MMDRIVEELQRSLDELRDAKNTPYFEELDNEFMTELEFAQRVTRRQIDVKHWTVSYFEKEEI